MTFTLEDLGLAYRKAKVDLYYSSHVSLLDIYEYERNLVANLQSLLLRLNGSDETWVNDQSFLGGWTLAAKSIETDSDCHAAGGLIFSSPTRKWELASSENKRTAEFRLMAKVGLDFHVLSALWIMKVGHFYDGKLAECAYGNRLRRTHDGKINPLSLGSFKPYLQPFREWRDKGLGAMRAALEEKKRVVAITADVSSFYHELSPSFMLSDGFNKLFSLMLLPEDEKLHRLFVHALEAWAQSTPLKRGLPVGLPASAVVANVALLELDRLVMAEAAPLYYGRYVDDIMLVMENGANFERSEDVWEWLFDRMNGRLGWADEVDHSKIEFHPDYLVGSRVHFANRKNKIFVMEGGSGLVLLDSIARAVHERASEWRALPNLPASAGAVSTDLVAAMQSDGEVADNLRKADALSMRRAKFAIKLRDFEAYERDLPPDAWREHRHAFLDAFVQHVMVLPCFFDLEQYLPRVVKLATACEDFKHLHAILSAMNRIVAAVDADCVCRIKAFTGSDLPGHTELINRWKVQIFDSFHQSVIAAFPPRLSKRGKEDWNLYIVDSAHEIASLSIGELQREHARWFSYDLAHMPFRSIGLPRELIAQRGIPSKAGVTLAEDAGALLPGVVVEGCKTLAAWIGFKKAVPCGLLFATRPFNIAELFLLPRDAFDEAVRPALTSVVLAIRGFSLTEKLPHFNRKGVLEISDGGLAESKTIAVSSWKTDMSSWVASVTRSVDPNSLDRYKRLTRLINGLISQPRSADYFILPELSLPAQWFMRIAQKLQGRGISLISGIEYLHTSRGRVRHQVWSALSHDGLGFPSMMIYRQDKQRPAFHEELELKRVAGLELKPDKIWKAPPVIQHGGFRFAILVCSELTNIGYRASLRGQVDALFVPEWNPDTDTFNALVESAALDVHAYIVQCNDRQYGDSRIRAPAKESWGRDVLRVKGGMADYCVVGDVAIDKLRRFQSSHRSPPMPYKPVPDGFLIAHERIALPIE